MNSKESFNIFSNNQQQKIRNTTLSLFSVVSQPKQNKIQKLIAKQRISKKQHFQTQIRRGKKDQVKKSMREKMLKNLEENDFFCLLSQMVIKNGFQLKDQQKFLYDLKKNMNSFGFCLKLDQNDELKKFIVDIYTSNIFELQTKQKCLLVQSLILLTYYNSRNLELSQKEKIFNTTVNQIQGLNQWNFQVTRYLMDLISLITNLSADQDSKFVNSILQSNLFQIIAQKITQLHNHARRIKEEQHDEILYRKYIEELNDVYTSFIDTLKNVSNPKYEHLGLFQFTMHEIVNDKNYSILSGDKVIAILTNFFKVSEYREQFIQNPTLIHWFEDQICVLSQKRFSDSESKKKGQFEDVIMSEEEKQIFCHFLTCLLVLLNEEEDEANYESIELIVKQNLNGYCLSEFLIQSAGHDGSGISKCKQTAKAIEMYEYLASDPKISINELLIVTSQRIFEDIIKVFFDEAYFTSPKISDITASVLNKMLSKDHNLLRTFIELGIFESIENFLLQDMSVQFQQQITNFLQLLTLMIAADDDGKSQNKQNHVARLLELKGFIQKIERYQDFENKDVASKAEAFLSYFNIVKKTNSVSDVIDI